MNDFAYARPATAADALHLASEPGTSYLGGGTELLNWLRLGIAEPAQLVDLSRLTELRGVRTEGRALWIGAGATLAEVEADAAVRREAPVLAQACLRSASPQIRNRATLGGNVLQKTRCAYFRAESPLAWPCNKREPGSGCAAREGSHERHAILGWTDACVATQPSDPVVALACLDAVAELQGTGGRRSVAVRELLLAQQEAARLGATRADEARLESRLRPGELIVGYRIPLGASRRSAYVKVRERESYEYAMVSAAAALVTVAGVIRQARVALGSVAQRPWRLPQAESALAGLRPDDTEAVTRAVRIALDAEARPLPRNAFKVALAANAAARAVRNAGRQA